jgi:hypothetical protein
MFAPEQSGSEAEMAALIAGGVVAGGCVLVVAGFAVENAGRTVSLSVGQHLVVVAVSAVLMAGMVIGLVFALGAALVLEGLSRLLDRHRKARRTAARVRALGTSGSRGRLRPSPAAAPTPQLTRSTDGTARAG